MNLGGDDLEGVRPDRHAPQLHTGHLALEPPRVAIDIENSTAQQIAEDRGEWSSFGVVVEPGFEDVLNVFRVGSDYVSEDVNVNGPGGRLFEKMGVPVAEIVKIFGPARSQEAPADVAVAPRPEPENEDEQGKEREESREGEEDDAESGVNGF